MAITRLQILNNKKSALMKQQIREIAMLLAESPPKEEKAQIKAETLIRDDDTVEDCRQPHRAPNTIFFCFCVAEC